MIRSMNRLALGIALLLLAAWGVMAISGTALAQEPSDPTEVRLTFQEPRASGSNVSVSVLLTTAEGDPLARQPVEFFVVPDFFGERTLSLQTALTNAQGVATITYVPTWEGGHKLLARFGGDATYQPGEVTAVLTVSGLPVVPIDESTSLSPVRQWAAPGVALVAIAVWLALAWVLFRVSWGIWQAGRSRAAGVTSPRPAAVGRFPGSTHR